MPRKKEFDREEVLDLAMELFRRRGFEATSMQDLVDGMGINRFSLYDSFGGKDELFLECLRRYNRTCIRATLDLLEQSEEGVGCIEKAFQAFIQSVKAGSGNGCLMINTIVESSTLPGQVSRICKQYLKSLEKAFAGALERAAALGELPAAADISARAKFLVNSMQGLGVLARMLNRGELEVYAETITGSLAA